MSMPHCIQWRLRKDKISHQFLFVQEAQIMYIPAMSIVMLLSSLLDRHFSHTHLFQWSCKQVGAIVECGTRACHHIRAAPWMCVCVSVCVHTRASHSH